MSDLYFTDEDNSILNTNSSRVREKIVNCVVNEFLASDGFNEISKYVNFENVMAYGVKYEDGKIVVIYSRCRDGDPDDPIYCRDLMKSGITSKLTAYEVELMGSWQYYDFVDPGSRNTLCDMATNALDEYYSQCELTALEKQSNKMLSEFFDEDRAEDICVQKYMCDDVVFLLAYPDIEIPHICYKYKECDPVEWIDIVEACA